MTPEVKGHSSDLLSHLSSAFLARAPRLHFSLLCCSLRSNLSGSFADLRGLMEKGVGLGEAQESGFVICTPAHLDSGGTLEETQKSE